MLEGDRQCYALKLPQAYAETAYQPTKYCTEPARGEQVVRVFPGDFVYRKAP